MVWSSQIEGTNFGNAVGSLGTYQARLSGFMALADLNNWTPFGMDEGRVPLSHDQISETLLKMGYVSLFIMFLIGSVSAFWWHRKCLRVRNLEDRVFLVSLSAIIVSLSICGLAYGNMLFVSPVNSLLGVMIGLGMVTLRRDQAAKMLEVPARVSFMARAIAGRGADLEIQSLNVNHP
jgi:sulfur relay (sulfurtransferase) DsrF/TusC family protein